MKVIILKILDQCSIINSRGTRDIEIIEIIGYFRYIAIDMIKFKIFIIKFKILTIIAIIFIIPYHYHFLLLPYHFAYHRFKMLHVGNTKL